MSYTDIISFHFPGGPGLAGTRMPTFWIILEIRMMEVVVTTGALRRAKLQSNRHHQQTNTAVLLQADTLPVTRPTVPEHRRKIYWYHHRN